MDIEPVSHPIDVWHRLVAEGDLAGLDALLAEDAVFYSPVVYTPQRGKPLVKAYLTGAFLLFSGSDFHYVREIRGANDAMLEFEAQIEGIVINGVDIIHWNDQGQITEFKVMIRPLKAIQLVHQKMAALLDAMSQGKA